ncbi:MAG: hypothetical protein ACXABY_07830 [Candidatus Thorarchaeota archaeon]|jgi:hypothetical protein
MIEQLKTSNLAEMFQRFVKDFVRPLEENAQLDYVDVSGVALVSGVNNTFDHGLGRQPIGWFFTDIVRDTGVAAPGNFIERVSWDSRSLTLLNSTGINITVNIRIY